MKKKDALRYWKIEPHAPSEKVLKFPTRLTKNRLQKKPSPPLSAKKLTKCMPVTDIFFVNHRHLEPGFKHVKSVAVAN
jgi:hypothetical protein